jgi:hypothetical protein
VPFYIEYFSQNLPFRDSIVCNERLDRPLNGCFRARMSFLIVLETSIIAIPSGILKNVEFYDGLMPVFCGSGPCLDYLKLHSFMHKSWIDLTLKTLARAKVRASRARLALGRRSARLRSAS